ncbi:TraB/GumN family protein [Sphingomonas koreensis]|nr:TraB/GumN family protein [Sphingomonas koreensis]
MALALAAIGVLSASACHRAPTIAAHPALWRVQDGDTTIWLFGTIHLLPARVAWQTPAVKRAIATTDTLVTEIPDGNLASQAATFLKIARAPGLSPVVTRVPAAAQSTLRAAAAASGVPLATLDGMKSWAAAVAIAVGSSRAADASVENGVETRLFAAFAGRRQLAFETLAGQLALFDALREDQQRLLLARSASEALSAKASYAATLDAWAAGNERRIAASFDPTFRGAPALEAALLTNRNAHFAGWIARRMDTPGSVLVAVGAGHLVGPKSVVAMLRVRGLRVERVE